MWFREEIIMLQSALLFVASALWLGGAHAADAASTFQSSKGDLPLILTVPHDGTADRKSVV